MHTPLFLFLGDLGGSEIMLILVVILIFFGANKIPELARGLGKGIREFKDASTEIRKEFENAGQPGSAQSPQSYAPPAPAQIPAPAPPVAAEPLPVDPATNYAAPVGAPEGTQPRQPYAPPAPEA